MLMGWGGWTLPEVHLPHMVEAGPLIGVTLAFVAAAVWLFRRFGEPSSAAATADRELAELIAAIEDRQLQPATEDLADADREREPAGV
jgi:hypothetical protein